MKRFGGAVKSVIGDDDRSIVLQPDARICLLEIVSPRGRFRGTGWLAGKATVITAGHCLFRRADLGGMATSVSVYPGRSQTSVPHGPYLSRTFACAEAWLASEDVESDIGAIHLDEPIGDRLGTLSYAVADAQTVRDARVTVTGYPVIGDIFDDPWTAAGRVHAIGPKRLFYDTDTSKGESGAPVWLTSDDASDPTVIAVHTYEKESTPPGLPETNSGTLITHEVAALIAQWLGNNQ